jgi:hypothetical protein
LAASRPLWSLTREIDCAEFHSRGTLFLNLSAAERVAEDASHFVSSVSGGTSGQMSQSECCGGTF